VSQAERRLAEAAKLGMTQAFLSDRAVPRRVPAGMDVIGVHSLADVLQRTVGRRAAPEAA
jgi:DNA repair protein RadA/Sms